LLKKRQLGRALSGKEGNLFCKLKGAGLYASSPGFLTQVQTLKSRMPSMKVALDGDEIKLYDFSALQAYKIGKHLEEQGIQFYENMLHNATDDGLKEGLRFLLAEEKAHLTFFIQNIEELTKTSEDGFEGDDIAAYMDSNVFTLFADNEEIQRIVQDREKAINFGKIIEKRSISFYEGCVENTNDQKVKSAFEGLVEAERQHLRKLEAFGLAHK